MQSPTEATESAVCPFLMTSIVGGHGCLARSNDAIMISPRYVTSCCLTGEHAGCSLYRNGDPVAMARVREYRYQQSKRLADEHRKAKNLPDESQQAAADSPLEEQTPMTSEASEPGAGTPNGHRSESKMSLLDMLRAPTMQELEEGPGPVRERGHRADAPAPGHHSDAENLPSAAGPHSESTLEPADAAASVTQAEAPSLQEREADPSANTPPDSPVFFDETESLTLEPAQPGLPGRSGLTPNLQAPAEMELFAEMVTVEAEQQWVTLEPLTYEVEPAPAPDVRPVDDSSRTRPTEPLPPESPSHQEAKGTGRVDPERPPEASADDLAGGQTAEPPPIDDTKERQEPMASEPAAVTDEQPSLEMAEAQPAPVPHPVDDPAPLPDTTYSWQPGTVEEIRPSREPRVADTRSSPPPVHETPIRPATPVTDEPPWARQVQREEQVPQPGGWTAGLKGWTRRKVALLVLIVVLGSGDVITLLPRLARTQSTPAPARVWQFPQMLGSADQVLLMFSNSTKSTITVQVRMTGSTGAASKTVRVPTGTETELALSPGTATDSLAISASTPFLVQRMVMQNNRVQSSYGLPGVADRTSASGKASRPRP